MKAISEDPDQTPHNYYAVSDLGLHCLPMSRVGIPPRPSNFFEQKIRSTIAPLHPGV